MRYESPLQLKHALANYGVAHGYKLWYYRSDYKCLLVYCGRDISLGRCAGKKRTKGKKTREMQQKAKMTGKGKSIQSPMK